MPPSLAPRVLSKRASIVACLTSASLVAACHGGSQSPAAAAAPVAPSPPPLVTERYADLTHGYFLGNVTTGKGSFDLDALLTVDGAIRMQATAEDSWQFAGRLHLAEGRLEGSGNLIGEDCLPVASGLCPTTTGALIRLTSADASRLEGAIHVADDTWNFTLAWPSPLAMSSYRASPDLASIDGHYEIRLGDFSSAEALIMSVDRAGRMFFQSAAQGCTGNGIIQPHSDTRFNVFEVSLAIDNCASDQARLNGSFQGLATVNVQTPWDYGDALLMWLATSDDVLGSTAIELRGLPR